MAVPPRLKGFEPIGLSCAETSCIAILFEEYEALRLAVYQKMPQNEAAEKMQVSRPTFTRIYNSAIQKVAQAFVEGRSILFDGGDVEFDQEWLRCNQCHTVYLPINGLSQCPSCGAEDMEDINESLSGWREQGRKQRCCHANKPDECKRCKQNKSGKEGNPCGKEHCPYCKE